MKPILLSLFAVALLSACNDKSDEMLYLLTGQRGAAEENQRQSDTYDAAEQDTSDIVEADRFDTWKPDIQDTADPDLCQPRCADKECGPDGCGGLCGTCTGQNACVVEQCVCQPACAGKECGADGCGGSCGSCAAGENCWPPGQCQGDFFVACGTDFGCPEGQVCFGSDHQNPANDFCTIACTTHQDCPGVLWCRTVASGSVCLPAACGDDMCTPGENATNCPADCGG